MFPLSLRSRGIQLLTTRTTIKTRPQIHRLNYAAASQWKRSYTTPSLLDLVKRLRKETQAGVADCKDALLASDMDIDKAKEWLVEKAKKTAAKKSNKLAYEGGVLAGVKDNKGVMIELNCETDFAARDVNFISTLQEIATTVLSASPSIPTNFDVSNILSLPFSGIVAGIEVTSVAQALEQLTFLIKENIKMRRVYLCLPDPGANSYIYSYVHNIVSPAAPDTFGKLGKIGVLIKFNTSEKLNEKHEADFAKFAFYLGAHIAAAKPKYIINPPEGYVEPPKDEEEDVDEDYVPSLYKQKYLFDNSVTVEEELKKRGKEIGVNIEVKEFVRWELSEGIVKTEGNLASDVNELLKRHEK